MKTIIRFSRRLLLAVTAAASCGAGADDYHYVNMLIGDRASGMGGAYTAVSDDATGMFYNPAGIIYTRGRSLSASVNAYHTTSMSYRSVLGGGDWNRESASLLPNFFGVVQPLGPGVVGFSYAVTDSMQENLAQRFTNVPVAGGTIDDYIINVNNSDSTYKFGPSYAFEVTPKLSVGVTLYAHVRATETIMNQVLTGINPGGDYDHTLSYAQSNEWGFEPVFGMMWNPMDKLALGMAVRQTNIYGSKLRLQTTCETSLAGTPNDGCHDGAGNPYTTPYSQIGETRAKRVYPTQVSLGAAWFPSESLLLTGDYTYYTAVNGEAPKSLDSTFRGKTATWNASLGAEYYLSSTWALRGGAYTNNANTPAITSGVANQPEHVNLTGFAGSVSHFTRSSSITAGISYASGTGLAQVVNQSADRQKLVMTATTFFLSTSYNY